MIGGVESESGYSDNVGPDTQASVAAKCAYVKEHNLAGLFEWRMDNDMRPDTSPPTYQVTGWVTTACRSNLIFYSVRAAGNPGSIFI